MIDRLKERVEQLKQELARGQQRLAELDNERTQLQQVLLRISGAIQVLDEEIESQNAEKPVEA